MYFESRCKSIILLESSQGLKEKKILANAIN